MQCLAHVFYNMQNYSHSKISLSFGLYAFASTLKIG